MIQSMPVVSHSYVETPPEDTVICRFMDFDKFRDLFANEELYLRRTDSLRRMIHGKRCHRTNTSEQHSASVDTTLPTS